MRYNIYNRFKVLALSGLLAIGSAGCTDFEEMNTDPDQPSDVPAAYILSYAQKNLMDDTWDAWANGRFGLVYAQYWGQQAYPAESRYQARPSEDNSNWNSWYAGALMDFQKVIDINTANHIGAVSDNQIAAARIMKVWTAQLVTDIWGDVPYTDALTGNEIKNPSYTSQKEIYTDLLKELDEAYEQIDVAVNIDGDVIYDGDMAQWQKFANSLRMRVAMRIADTEMEAEAEAAFQKAYNSGVYMKTDADNALLVYAGAPHNNPLHEDRKTRADFAVSNTLVDKLTDLGDPRLSVYADTTKASGGYVGVVYGLEDNTANNLDLNTISQPGIAVLSQESPGMYMVSAEVCFLIAEAVERGWIAGDAAQAYAEGIRCSMVQWGVDAAATEAYITANPYDAANWKTSIGVQKWLALYMQGHQGWIEWRRLDFGVLRAPKDGYLPTDLETIPTRRQYPIDEQTLNTANYDAASAAIGGDKLDTRVWWDTEPGTVVPAE